MFKTSISQYKGFDRTIELKGQNLDEDNVLLVNTCKLTHSISGVEIPEMNKIIILTCDNKAEVPYVDTNNNPVMIGDFDIISTQSEAGVASKDLFEALIAYCDSIGKINTKANYQF